ncbi:unnamed protein product [Ectocarpus sp. CCAP 1310/34]|nr:unnamed protein product [Ectocarpus sp. CCAP 1310/34]
MKAAAEEAASQPTQKVAVSPENADGGNNQAAITPEFPRETAGFGADNDVGGGSEDAVTSSTAAAATPPPAPTPTPSPREPNDKDAAATPVSTLPAQESAPDAASRTICLRPLPETKPIRPLSSLAGWGGVTKAAAAAAASTGGQEIAGSGTPPPPEVAAVNGQADAVLVGEKVGGGGLGVLPSANKVVDLREVKKVKPGPLAASAPVPDDSEGEEEGAGGPVKIDISAGKRMIEFQLKQNAAEEKREAARVKNEKGMADAAIAEGSQRMLAQVNARMEAQRRGRGGGSGVLGSWGATEENVTSQHDSTTVHAIDQSQIRNLAEKHGIVVRFVDDGAASGVSQVRALARAHGIRILVVGEDGGGSSDGRVEDDEALAAGGNGRAARGASVTPPPTLSSLRTQAAPARRSRSPTPPLPTKAPPRKPSVVPPAAGGIFSGPARMMRRALEASGGCVPSAKDVSPVADRGGNRASPPPGDNQGGSAPPAADARTVLAPTAGAALVGNGQPARGVASGGDDSMSGKGGGAGRPRPSCAESGACSVGAAAAASNGVRGIVVPGPASRAARSHGESSRRREGGSRVGAAAAAAAAAAAVAVAEAAAATAPDSSAGKLVGRKRRATMGDSSDQERGGEGKGAHDTTAAIRKRAVEGGGGSGTVGGGGRMEGRLGYRGVGPSEEEEEEGAEAVSARTSPEAMATPTVQSSAPKRMRLVAPSGVVVSQASATPTTKSGRRSSTGGAGWGAGVSLVR